MISRKNSAFFLAVIICILFSATAASCSTFFVSPAGDDTYDGASWSTAKKTVQGALSVAVADDEIWVAKGIYTSCWPAGNITNDVIILKDRVSLYGGFSGAENTRAERNPSSNQTILDGTGSTTSVVYSPANVSASTVIDGFVICNGDNCNSEINIRGRGGIECYSSSPVISNNVITRNSVGITSIGSSPTIINNKICDNDDSGIVISSSLALAVTVAGNTIYGNGSSGDGGGIRCSGAAVTISNNTIIGNSASLDGGAISLSALTGSYQAVMTNNVIAYNSSGLYNESGALYTVTMRNNCVFGNTSYNYLGITDPTGTNGNISQDPKLADQKFARLHLLSDSPCINAGNDADAQAGYVDMDSLSRIYGTHVDIGADEYDGTTWSGGPNAIVKVSPTGDDANDGLTWGQAKRTVQSAIDAASAVGAEIWVAQGTYKECLLLRPYAYLYGGFWGSETAKSDRNWSINQTILDGDGQGTVVSAFNGHLTSAIDGFTIRGGAPAKTGNARRGGGVVCVGCSPEIANNIFSQNNAYEGGAVYLDRSAAQVINNIIKGNSAEQGGAVFLANSYSNAPSLIPRLSSNTIISNIASDNAAIYCAVPGAVLQNNIIAFNDTGVLSANAAPAMTNNCVYGNYLYNFSGFADPTGANGNKSEDPKIVLHQSGFPHIIPTSPCIDSGDDLAVQASLDIYMQPRISGNRVDIGAEEFNGTVWGDDTDIIRFNTSIIKVSKTGDDSNDGLTWETAKLTVNAAISASGAGDHIWVAKGQYNENITANKWTVLYGGFTGNETSISERPAFPRANPDANATILDGQSLGSVVIFAPGVGSTPILDGFTIRNGNAIQGAGIYSNASSPIISNNIITNNTATGTNIAFGGGIYCANGSPTIVNNTIKSNTAQATYTSNNIYYYGGCGGGIYCTNGSPMILNNVISGNTASNTASGGYAFGGGIHCYFSSATIANNSITANSATNSISGGYGSGGGIYCSTSSPVSITNNTIASNNASGDTPTAWGYGGGIFCSSPYTAPYPTPKTVLTNNIVAFNSSGISKSGSYDPTLSYNCVFSNNSNYAGLSAGYRDIFTDPMIVASADGAFHIQPTSPCRNAGYNLAPGLPSTDIDGQSRPEGGTVDVGADESYGETWSFPEDYAIHVSPNGNDSNRGLTWDTAKKTMTAGIDACLTGSEVWVAAGIYMEHITLKNRVALYGGFAGAETVRNQRNWETNQTILDGNKAGSVVTSPSGITISTIIDGITIRNGKASSGGGICCSWSSPTISNNTITGNTAEERGGGIYCYSSSPTISNNLITGNTTTDQGAGIYCYGSATISNNTIVGNNISSPGGPYAPCGGGIFCDGSARISNNTIVGNTTNSNNSSGGGIFCAGSPTITNNVIATNFSGIYKSGGTPALQNNCVYANTAYNYSGLTAGTGDISIDPLFVDQTNGNYHLKATSPCINAGWNSASGLPLTDMDGQPRILGAIVEIGADEYQPSGDYTTISGAKRAAVDSWVELTGDIVTARFGDAFYIENLKRTSGLRIEKPSHTLDRDMKAHVFGKLKTNPDGEVYLDASVAERNGTQTELIEPWSLINRSLGGGTFGLQSGITGASGLNNIGLLVQVWGRVTEVTSNSFKIDDGSAASIKCIIPFGVNIDETWQYVSVTGVSSCENDGGKIVRLLRVREQSDITPR